MDSHSVTATRLTLVLLQGTENDWDYRHWRKEGPIRFACDAQQHSS